MTNSICDNLTHYGKPYNAVIKVNEKPFIRLDIPKSLTQEQGSDNCRVMNETKKKKFFDQMRKETREKIEAEKQDKKIKNIGLSTSNSINKDK